MTNDFLSRKVEQLPNSAYYVPDFITSSEEQELLDGIYAAPKPKWKTLLNRRLQNWGGLPHPKGMIKEDLPEWLATCVQKVIDLGVFGEKMPNHVLVNEYLPGQGIMPHEDGPLFHPVIATVNLGSHTVLDYYEKGEDQSVGSLLLARRSLLLVKDDLYCKFLHGITERRADTLGGEIKNLAMCDYAMGTELERETRISLTIRHVPRTISTKFLFNRK